MKNTKILKKLLYYLLLVWVLWYMPSFIFEYNKLLNIISLIGIFFTLAIIIYLICCIIYEVWKIERKEKIIETNKFLFNKYLGSIQCVEGNILPEEVEQNIIYNNRDVNVLYEINGSLNKINFVYRGIHIQREEWSSMSKADSRKITRNYFKGNTLKWSDSKFDIESDLIFFTDAMEGSCQTYPKVYGYEKIHECEDKSVIYSKGTCNINAIERLCQIYKIVNEHYIKYHKVDFIFVAIFVKGCNIEVFIDNYKIKNLELMKDIEFIEDVLKHLQV